MDQASKAAFIIAQAACATADIMGMQAENLSRISLGQSIAYDHDAFLAVQTNYCIGHNQVIDYLRD